MSTLPPHRLPQAVLFDLGGTLLTETQIDLKAATEWLVESQSSGSQRLDGAEVRALYHEVRETLRSGVVEFRIQGFLQLIRDRGGWQQESPLAEIELEFWRRLCAMEAMPGVEAVLQQLRDRQIVAGVVSNSMFSQRVLDYELRRNHLRDYFQMVSSSADYGLQKPHPAIFEAALGRCGVSASDTWFVGDNYHKDVLGAAGVGIRPIWLNPDAASAELPAGGVRIHTWSEFSSLL